MISIDSEVDQTDASPDYASRIQALTEEIQQSSGDNAAALYEALGQVQLKVGAVDSAVEPIRRAESALATTRGFS